MNSLCGEFDIKAVFLLGEKIADESVEYGDYLLKNLSKELTKEFGKGFTITNLKYMRQFYLAFSKGHTLCDQLSWSHYRLLSKIDDENIRRFYVDECVEGNWSVRQLERQINSFYYQRILASQNKQSVRNEIKQLEKGIQAEDIIKDPFVLEFMGLSDHRDFTEIEVEKALMDNLQKFLLELGKGFSFVARQKGITAEGDHFYIVLVFYNYILKCFILIDLKLGKLSHQYIGKMDFSMEESCSYARKQVNRVLKIADGLAASQDKASEAAWYYELARDIQKVAEVER